MSDDLKEMLIAGVFERRPLWDQRYSDHHNRFKLDKLWAEVANKCGLSNADVKKKWKSLRQQFKEKWEKLPTPTSGDPSPEYSVDWPYFKSMLFLRENFEKRATSGNLSVPRHVNEATDETLFEFDEDEEDAHTSNSLATTLPTSGLSQQGSLPVTPSSTPPISGEVLGYRKRSRPLDPIGKELVEIEKEKLKMRKEKENQTLNKNDEDVAFFTSLLPHMKRMAPVDKIMFRIEVEKLVVQKAYGVEYGSLNRRDDNLPHTSTQSRACFPPPLSSDNILPYGGPHFPALLHPNPASYSHTALPPPHRSEIDVPGSSQMNRSSVQSVNNPGFDGGQVYNNMQNMPM